MKRKIIIGLAVIAVVIVAIFFFKGGKAELKLNTTTVGEGSIEQSVTATGYIQPVDKVDVGTQVSGVIEKIYVDYNTQVKRGELLAELDKSTLNERLSQAKATLESAESDLKFAQQNYDRIKQLYDVKATTQASYEEASNKLIQAKTSLTDAKASLHQAEVNLSYAEIYSPIDGIVLDRAVEQGQTVAASFSTPTLFTIANDLRNMQVEADVDEADIGSVRVGQPVIFTVDSYPDDVFNGTVKQIRLQPTVTSNVVTYTVIIDAPNPDEKLYPGMTASVTITTESESGLVVPVEALNFSPNPSLHKELSIAITEESNPNAKGVWIKTTGSITRKNVEVGMSDGVNTIVRKGIAEGDTVVLSASYEKKSGGAKAASNPFMPRGPQRRR